MTKGYTRTASICVAPIQGEGEAYRTGYELANVLVSTGMWKFTSKGRWRKDGRLYWEE